MFYLNENHLVAGAAEVAGGVVAVGAADGAGGGVAFSAVGVPGTTTVVVENLRAFSSSAALEKIWTEFVVIPYFSSRAFCSAATSALFFKRTGLRGSDGFPPAKPCIIDASTEKDARAAMVPKSTDTVFDDDVFVVVDMRKDQFTAFTDSSNRGSRHGYKLAVAKRLR